MNLIELGEDRIGSYVDTSGATADVDLEVGDVVRVDAGTAYACQWSEANGLVTTGAVEGGTAQVANFTSSSAADSAWSTEAAFRTNLKAGLTTLGVTKAAVAALPSEQRAAIKRVFKLVEPYL